MLLKCPVPRSATETLFQQMGKADITINLLFNGLFPSTRGLSVIQRTCFTVQRVCENVLRVLQDVRPCVCQCLWD